MTGAPKFKLGQIVWWCFHDPMSYDSVEKDRIDAIVQRKKGTFYLLASDSEGNEWPPEHLYASKQEAEGALNPLTERDP